MNTNSDNRSSDDTRFDRLVDGELSEQQRHELLVGLDSEPGGWRRCALAFLESQCWKQTFGPMAGEAVTSEASPRPMRLPRARSTGLVGTLLAMAACFLMAFWVGSLVNQSGINRRVGPTLMPSEVATTIDARPVPASSGRQLVGATSQAPQASGPWRMVTVSSPAGTGSAMRLPAVERDNIDQQWLQSLPPAVPDDVMQAFNRTGHQIETHRELVPVPMQDGRRLVVPVDQVDIHYVGDGTY